MKRKVFLYIFSASLTTAALAMIFVLSFSRAVGTNEDAPGRSMEKKVKIHVNSSSRNQDVFEISIDTPESFFSSSQEDHVYSWAFVPESVEDAGSVAIKEYVYDKYFGFREDAPNVLIVDPAIVPRGNMKIALVRWSCATEDCDTYGEMSDPVFLPLDKINHGQLRNGFSKEKNL